jgi:hypothetical protein
MFGTKKGKVAPASYKGPIKPTGTPKGKAGMQKLGETGKAASAGGKKVK